MKKHTPGPWELRKLKRETLSIDVVAESKVIAMIRHTGSTSPSPEKCKFNANLVAAAPELLAACYSAYYSVMNDENDSHALPLETLQKLRDAIAKAEGH